jgi:hypothetical protein
MHRSLRSQQSPAPAHFSPSLEQPLEAEPHAPLPLIDPAQ